MLRNNFLILFLLLALFTEFSFGQRITYQPLYTFYGEDLDGTFGSAVGGAGDVNGDGFDDLIVGAYNNSDVNGNGSARVYSGLDGSILHTFHGDNQGDSFGTSVSGIGDVNGDGFADVVVGAIGVDTNPSANLRSTGAARVFSGIDGSVLYTVNNSSSGGFGRSVSGIGDVNADGIPDFVVGAADGNNPYAEVISGDDGSVLHSLSGNGFRSDFGFSVKGVGDVDGDSIPDLIVGAPDHEVTPTNNGDVPGPGRANVYSGATGNIIHTFDGDTAGDNFGISVGSPGDLNGDGFAEIVVGASSDDNSASNSGNAKVFSGIDGSILLSIDGGGPNQFVGRQVEAAGDVNGDGIGDILVGAIGFDSPGWARIYSGSDGDLLQEFVGDLGADLFGYSIDSAGDVNGDGLPDFIVGGGAFNGSRPDGGYARVFVSTISVPEPSGMVTLIPLLGIVFRRKRKHDS